jgi:hypothetical protein
MGSTDCGSRSSTLEKIRKLVDLTVFKKRAAPIPLTARRPAPEATAIVVPF